MKVLLSTVLLISQAVSPACAERLDSYVMVEERYLKEKPTDTDAQAYGVEYYATSTYGKPLCLYARIREKQGPNGKTVKDWLNVDGSVQAGPLVLKPREKNVRFGAFRNKQDSKWYVHIQWIADDECLTP